MVAIPPSPTLPDCVLALTDLPFTSQHGTDTFLKRLQLRLNHSGYRQRIDIAKVVVHQSPRAWIRRILSIASRM